MSALDWTDFLPGASRAQTLQALNAQRAVGDRRYSLGAVHRVSRALIAWRMAYGLPARFRPARIVQFWDDETPPPDVLECMESWRATGLPIQRFSEASARAFMAEIYPPQMLQAFDACPHPASKSDLLRLAALYHGGGLYVDADDRLAPGETGAELLFGAPLALMPLAHEGLTMLPVRDTLRDRPDAPYVGYYFNTTPLFGTRAHPLLKLALEMAIMNALESVAAGRSVDPHEDVGPTSLTRAVTGHAMDMLEAGRTPDLDIRIDWPELRLFETLDYKSTSRNWRNA
ncbi:glycosyltransferase family 32 protein [Rhodovarius crocodyli]|nr:glycosyltransferase [Rhodovarius crocodyli]